MTSDRIIDRDAIDAAILEGMAARGTSTKTLSSFMADQVAGRNDYEQSETMYASLLGVLLVDLIQYAEDHCAETTGPLSISVMHECYPDATPWELIQVLQTATFISAFLAGVQAAKTMQS